MDDLEARNLTIVPTLVWNPPQYAELENETLQDLIAKPGSKSRATLWKYASEFVNRYKARHAIAFYELTNELNLMADLDNVKRAPGTSAGNYSTDELIAFARRWRITSARSTRPGSSRRATRPRVPAPSTSARSPSS